MRENISKRRVALRKAKRISNIPPYLFKEIERKKEELLRKDISIIDFSIGDPDLPTPQHILKKFHEAVDDPKTHNYPPYEGIGEFRFAVAKWYKNRFNVNLDPEREVISLIGSKEGIAHIFLAFIDPSDVALIPDPCYPPYKIGTLFTHGKPYPLPLLKENGFLPDFKKIDKGALKKAKILFINYPNNPTSAVANLEFYEEAVDFARRNRLLLCSDLAYSEVAFDGYRPMSALEVRGAKEVTIEFHSLSKTYNMSGWRIGMAVGSSEAIAALLVVKTNIDSGAFKAIQYAAAYALTSPQDEIGTRNKIYSERRDILVEGLQSLGCEIEKPKATFYLWVKVPKGYSSQNFAKTLLSKAKVLVVPGSGYGKYGEGYIRLSITTDKSNIEEAVERMKKSGIRW